MKNDSFLVLFTEGGDCDECKSFFNKGRSPTICDRWCEQLCSEDAEQCDRYFCFEPSFGNDKWITKETMKNGVFVFD